VIRIATGRWGESGKQDDASHPAAYCSCQLVSDDAHELELRVHVSVQSSVRCHANSKSHVSAEDGA
jgi:hypothetical protein